MVNGYVQPGYPETTAMMNPLSEMIIEPYGPDKGEPRLYRHRGGHRSSQLARCHLGRNRDHPAPNPEAL
jgi:hypothetical protein